ncbi:MAG: hypothetical protein ABI758_06965 [Candidatus Woesebacteria bacterium]
MADKPTDAATRIAEEIRAVGGREKVYKDLALEVIDRHVIQQGMGERGFAIYENFLRDLDAIPSWNKFTSRFEELTDAVGQSNLSGQEKALVLARIGKEIGRAKTNWAVENRDQVNKFVEALNVKVTDYAIKSREAARA